MEAHLSGNIPTMGDGRRVKKYVPGSPDEITIFVYDAGGKLIQEHSTIVQTGGNAKTVYTTSDCLGSPRINTDGVGNVISRHDYHPFGEEVDRSAIGYGSDTIRKQFTGYERDTETGLDYAQARYSMQKHGRFTSPDPYVIQFEIRKGKDANEQQEMFIEYLAEPRNHNRYVYALNNPLKYTDPTGMRPPNKWEKMALEKLDELIAAERKAGNTQLALALSNAKQEISQIIADLGMKENSRGVGIAVWAILHVGDKASDTKPSITLDGTTYGKGTKCNVFVAWAHRDGGNIKKGNYPMTDGVYPVANYLGDSQDRMKLNKNLPVVWGSPQVGDVVAWRYFEGRDSGHSSIYIGGGVVAYAGGGATGTPKVERMSVVNDGMDTQDGYIFNRTHDPGVIRRYNGKP